MTFQITEVLFIEFNIILSLNGFLAFSIFQKANNISRFFIKIWKIVIEICRYIRIKDYFFCVGRSVYA